MPAPTVSGGAGGGGIRILHLNKKTSIPEFQHTRNEWRAERRAALLDADELDELIVRVKNVTSGHRLAGGDIPQFEIVLQSKGLSDPNWYQAVTEALASFGELAGCRREFEPCSDDGNRGIFSCRCRFVDPTAPLRIMELGASGQLRIVVKGTLPDGSSTEESHRAYVDQRQHPRRALREAGSIEAQVREVRVGLCDSLFRGASPSPLLVLWRHACGRGESVHAQLNPGRRLLSVLLAVGRGRMCRANEPRCELRLDFKLTHLQGRVHLSTDGGHAAILTFLFRRPPLIFKRTPNGQPGGVFEASPDDAGDEFTRVTDLTAGQHLSYSNACQLLFPWVPTPEGLGFDPSLDSLLDLLAEMGLLATKPEDGSARSRRLSERAPLLILVAAEPPPLSSADTFRPAAPAAAAGASGGGSSSSVPADVDSALSAHFSLRCDHRFLSRAPAGSMGNSLGEKLGQLARGRLDLPFAVLYKVEQLATAGALCPTLRGQFLKTVADLFHGAEWGLSRPGGARAGGRSAGSMDWDDAGSVLGSSASSVMVRVGGNGGGGGGGWGAGGPSGGAPRITVGKPVQLDRSRRKRGPQQLPQPQPNLRGRPAAAAIVATAASGIVLRGRNDVVGDGWGSSSEDELEARLRRGGLQPPAMGAGAGAAGGGSGSGCALQERAQKCRWATVAALDRLVAKAHRMRGCRLLDAVAALKRAYREQSSPDSLSEARGAALQGSLGGKPLPQHLARVCRVNVTPTRVVCFPPEIEVTNRVCRLFGPAAAEECLLRVSFCDENMKTVFDRGDGQDLTAMYTHIRQVLTQGFWIAGRHFRFLAFSSNQLRNRGCWFYAAPDERTPPRPLNFDPGEADQLRFRLGHFAPIKVAAKNAARIGQCFSTTVATVVVSGHSEEHNPGGEWRRNVADVERNDFCFSDGVGTISPTLAQRVWSAYSEASRCFRGDTLFPSSFFGGSGAPPEARERIPDMPSAFQIRLGGCKGMVSLDARLTGSSIATRKSMHKFDACMERAAVEVCAHSKRMPCYCNRQLISILTSVWGIPCETFLEMQREMLRELDEALANTRVARRVLRSYGGLSPVLTEDMLRAFTAGVPVSEPFFNEIMRCVRQWHLQELLGRARIFVKDGATLFGVLDESDTLEYGEVFVQITDWDHGEEPRGVRGPVAVTKFPALHPGDVRALTAVSAEAMEQRRPGQGVGLYLGHLVNVLVFPQRGQRPHPNELAGSDLDGDEYFVTWDTRLLPPEGKRNEPAMDYTPAGKAQESTVVSADHIIDFYLDYLRRDNLGQIANAHLVWADKKPDGVRCAECLQLAALQSSAVDFAKTGVAADFPSDLRHQTWPHWMRKTDRPVYTSTSVIGRLFDEVECVSRERAAEESAAAETAAAAGGAGAGGADRYAFDEDFRVEGWDQYRAAALRAKEQYAREIFAIMDHYGVSSEAELVSGHILRLCREFRTGRSGGDVSADIREKIALEVFQLRQRFRERFAQDVRAEGLGEAEQAAAARRRAAAWYLVTYAPEEREAEAQGEASLLGFPWTVTDILADIKRTAA